MAAEVFATGHCLCGAVTVAASAPPFRMVQCHCKDCQRATGTGHISNALFNESDVAMCGETSSHSVVADSGNTLTRHFCPTCGSRLYAFTTGRPGAISVPVGLFDDTSWFKPHAVIYTKHRADWDVSAADVPSFDAMPPSVPKA